MDFLNIRCITWNLEGSNKPVDFDCNQLLGDNQKDIDIYVVGFQEISCRVDNLLRDIIFNGDDPWTKAIKEHLAGLDFVKITSRRYFGTAITLFCLRRHLHHLRKIESQYTSLALDLSWYGKNMASDLVGQKILNWPRAQKGAVSIRFELLSKEFCFICSHLEAHDYNIDIRIRQYNQVVENHRYKSNVHPTLLSHDYIIWMGDLNFRLEGPDLNFDNIVEDISSGNVEKLFQYDQLRKSRINKLAFDVFSEDESGPKFKPTYKFQIGTNLHDRKRSPAWTDRILYYLNDSKLGNSNENKIISSNYVSFNSENFYCSDHRPVSADFTASIKSSKTPNVINPNNPVRFFPAGTKPEWTIDDDNVRTLFLCIYYLFSMYILFLYFNVFLTII